MVTLSHDPESIPTHGVSCVVVEFIKWNLVGAVVPCPGGTIRDLGRSEPEAEMGATSTGIVSPLVVGVHNPETGRVDVRIQQGVGHSCENGKIVLQCVVLLNTILNEEGETLDIEDDIVFNQEVGDIMEGAGSVVGMMDSITPHIAVTNVSRKMEVNGVSSNSEGLTSIEELSVLNSGSNQTLVLVFGTDDDDGSHFI